MKRSTFRVISAAAALALTASLTACSDSALTEAGEGISASTTAATEPKTLDEEDARAVGEIDVEDVETLSNPVVRWLSFWDLNPANGKPKSVELELFETKYGGTIEYIPTTYETRYSDLSTLVLSGDSPDLFPAADLDTFPGKAVAGMLQPFDDYLDFDSDLWSEGAKKLSDAHTIDGKHYVAVVSTDAGCVIIYNKRIVAENGLDDPADLLAEDNWTWDTFKEMCLEFSDRESNKFAFDGWWFEINFLLTTGTPVISMDDGAITSNLNSAEMERAKNFMLELKRNDLPFPHDEYDWQVYPSCISEGLTLFYPCGIWALYEADLSAYGETDEIMFVPMPRDPDADEYYLPSGVDAYALCKGAQNPEGAAAFMKCKLIAVSDPAAQEIAEKQYREDYGWTDEMLEMWRITKDLTNENPDIDMYAGVSSDVYDMVHNPIKDASYNGKEWSVTRDEISDAVQTALDELNAKIAAGI
ncbi:MAG: extracellular solute-binding protein [Oscillospiraceae bacterium]|nr:extracellular solute-binding protein [Oscillospiraceae bacterium]